MHNVKMTKEEVQMLAKFASIKHRNLIPMYLYLCVGERFSATSWALSGRTMRFMTREEMLKTSMYARVYVYLRDNNFTDAAIHRIHVKYGLRNSRIRTIIGMGKRTEASVLKQLREQVTAK
jgi:hypothetical protein